LEDWNGCDHDRFVRFQQPSEAFKFVKPFSCNGTAAIATDMSVSNSHSAASVHDIRQQLFF